MAISRSCERALLLAASIGVSLGTAPFAHAAKPDVAHAVSSPGSAASLIQAALDAGQAGDASRRAELLKQALGADPEFAPARWHSGQVKFDGRWMPLDDVSRLVAYHRRWSDYRALRDSLGREPADHVQLAKYCDQNKLAREARFHWASVLQASPGDAAARKALGLVEYGGELMTADAAESARQQSRLSKERLAALRPEMTTLCRAAIRGDATRGAAALRAIAALDDPAGLDALEEAVAKVARKAPSAGRDLQLALIEAMSKMPQHDATLRLLDYAVFAAELDVRCAAARALAARPQTDYVPLLMAALTAPIDVETDVVAMPDGTVRLIETITQAGPNSRRTHVRNVNYETDGVLNYDRGKSDPAAVLNQHLSQAASIASATAADVDQINALTEERNARIVEVLKVATGVESEAQPEAWWQRWQEYNALQFVGSPEETTSVEFRDETFEYPQAFTLVPGAGTWQEVNNTCSCFAPGTLVWAQGGSVPIERVAVGDLVLSQDPASGELDYRPVLRTTVGLPTSVSRCASLRSASPPRWATASGSLDAAGRWPSSCSQRRGCMDLTAGPRWRRSNRRQTSPVTIWSSRDSTRTSSGSRSCWSTTCCVPNRRSARCPAARRFGIPCRSTRRCP